MKKNGLKDGKQLYKCAACGKRFVGGDRLDPVRIWVECTEGKQTYPQLAAKYNCSIKTIRRKIDMADVERETTFPSIANVLMDTAYFGSKFGVMVFKDSLTGTILLKKYVCRETNELYLEGIEEIAVGGIGIQAVICDGRKGLFHLFGEHMPVQMCNFHRVAIVLRYLTRKPKMQAGKELWQPSLLLVQTDRESFEGGLNAWYDTWKDFLNERKIDEKGKKRYTHKKLRSAYNSLENNMPLLFTRYDNMSLSIPNTTNVPLMVDFQS